MRRSILIMLAASVAVHAVVIGVYLWTRPAPKPGQKVPDQPSLYVSTLPISTISLEPRPTQSPPAIEPVSPPPSDQAPIETAVKAAPKSETLETVKAETIPQSTPLPQPSDSDQKHPLTPKLLETASLTVPPRPESLTPITQTAILTQIEPAPPGKPSVVFLLDVSGSMYEHDGATTRNDEARKKLLTLISALPSGTIFTVVYYAERSKIAGPFQDVAPGVDLSSSRLIFDEAPECGGGTNFPVGLKAALNLRPGKIVLITDGDLNMSLHDILAKAPPSLVQKKVSFSILGIHPRGDSDDGKLLQSLAERYRGSYLELEDK